MKYALQLFSIKNISEEQGLAATLKTAKDAGYDSVEFAGFYGMDIPAVLTELDKNGLEVMGLHHGVSELRNDAKACVELAKQLGAYSLCVPHYNTDTVEGWVDFAKEMNEYGKMFRDAGILFGFHNHVHELEPFNGTTKIDILLENSDKENVFFQMDTRHVALANVNPAEYAKKYEGRIPVLHVRDTTGEEDCAVGYGIVDFPAVVKSAGGIDMFVVENEKFGRNLDELKLSSEYLKKNF